MLKRLMVTGAVLAGLMAQPALAAKCGNTGAGFQQWLADFKRQAQAQGISPRVINATLSGVTYDPRVIRLDRRQKSFRISYEEFVRRKVTSWRIAKGRQMLKRHARLLSAIEQRYGVPPELLVAIWAMETDFGVNRGKMNVFRSLATLAYDCRRGHFFTNELMSALLIAERGYMPPSQMRGAWAGELGQTQFLASNYLKFAVDFDGNGRRDLMRSVPDVLASTANYLRGFGYQRGAGYHQPALKEWNKSDKYTRALALMATKLKGG